MNISDRAVSYLRTNVPVLWGLLVGQLLTWLAPHLPGELGAALEDWLRSELAVVLVTGVAIALWYWAWRRLESRIPDWLTRLVLGSAKTPVYVEPGADGVHAITTLTPAERALVDDVRLVEGRDPLP